MASPGQLDGPCNNLDETPVTSRVSVHGLVAVPDFRTCADENDVGHSLPDGRIVLIDRAAPALAFQPALVTHNLCDIWQFFPDELGLGIHGIT